MSFTSLPNVDLYFMLNHEKQKVLGIPRTEFQNYSSRPLKWLRFVAYTIYGAEGDIYEMEGSQPVLYDSVWDAEQLERSYLFQSKNEPHLIDFNALDDRVTVTSSSMTTGRQAFRETILARDGGRCVLTREEVSIEACHILPYSKTDSYIKAVTEARKTKGDDVVDVANDIRNGVMLKDTLHKAFGTGHLALLMTPNFALKTADVPKAAPFRVATKETVDLHDENGCRYTAHRFPGFDRVYTRLAPFGADAYFPGLHSDNPSSLLLDFWYGCSVFQAWGHVGFQNFVQQRMADDRVSYSQIPKHLRPPLNERTIADDEEARWMRKEMRMSKNRGEIMDMLLEISLLVQRERWSLNKERIKAHLRQKKIEEREANAAKVNDWRKGVVEAPLCIFNKK